MEFIKQAWAQIQEHLKSLNIRDKMLFAMILAVMILSIWMLLGNSSKPELVALIDQDIPAGEVATIQNCLDSWGESYTASGNRLMVKRQDRDRLIARLQMSKALPQDMREGWNKLILESNMWQSSKDRDRRWQLAMEQRLASVIAEMDDVRDAKVMINPGSKPRLNGPNTDPSASVYLGTRSGRKPEKSLVIAVADMIAGAVDGLLPARVNVIANGASYHTPDADSASSSDLLDTRVAWEKFYVDKITQSLGIPSVLVGVNVDLATEQVRTLEHKYGPEALSKERTRENNSNRADRSGEPGVRPNTGQSVENSSTNEEKTSETESETEYGGLRDTTQVEKTSLPGQVKSVRATINVPNSYFVRVYQQQSGKTDKPTAPQLEEVFRTYQKEIRAKVLPMIGAGGNADDDKLVEVSRYFDDIVLGEKVAEASSGIGGLSGSLVDYAKPAGLAVLALVSVMMVLMMMRKAAAEVVVSRAEAEEESFEPAPVLDAGGAPVGEAAQTEGVLQGVEVDEETVRVRKMSEQVATLVKEDPDAAATLVKQWIMQDQR